MNRIENSVLLLIIVSIGVVGLIFSMKFGDKNLSTYKVNDSILEIRHMKINNKSKMRSIFCKIRRVGFC